MSHITTHVLDTSRGCAAVGIKVILEQFLNDQWIKVGEDVTNQDGRCLQLFVNNGQALELVPGYFKLKFNTREYYQKLEIPSFFPFCEVVFEIPNPPQKHYHVPLIINPFSYSTYRGT